MSDNCRTVQTDCKAVYNQKVPNLKDRLKIRDHPSSSENLE
jgi:hypothetical protein